MSGLSGIKFEIEPSRSGERMVTLSQYEQELGAMSAEDVGLAPRPGPTRPYISHAGETLFLNRHPDGLAKTARSSAGLRTPPDLTISPVNQDGDGRCDVHPRTCSLEGFGIDGKGEIECSVLAERIAILSLSLSYYWVPIVLSGTLGTHFAEVVIGEN